MLGLDALKDYLFYKLVPADGEAPQFIFRSRQDSEVLKLPSGWDLGFTIIQGLSQQQVEEILFENARLMLLLPFCLLDNTLWQ